MKLSMKSVVAIAVWFENSPEKIAVANSPRKENIITRLISKDIIRYRY